MSETIIWEVLESIILKEGDCSRHEDKYKSGVPDISYGINDINGWIESKFIDKWPTRDKTVNLRKFTSQQRRWITKRNNSGGNCYIILLVGKEKRNREFLIFSGDYAMKLGHVTRNEMYKNCVWYGNDKEIQDVVIIDILTGYNTSF